MTDEEFTKRIRDIYLAELKEVSPTESNYPIRLFLQVLDRVTPQEYVMLYRHMHKITMN